MEKIEDVKWDSKHLGANASCATVESGDGDTGYSFRIDISR